MNHEKYDSSLKTVNNALSPQTALSRCKVICNNSSVGDHDHSPCFYLHSDRPLGETCSKMARGLQRAPYPHWYCQGCRQARARADRKLTSMVFFVPAPNVDLRHHQKNTARYYNIKMVTWASVSPKGHPGPYEGQASPKTLTVTFFCPPLKLVSSLR